MAASSDTRHDDSEPRRLGERAVRALTECMTVLPADGPGLYTVVGENAGGEYLVDVRDGVCSCPDYTYREPPQGCKHLWRVRYATGRTAIPPAVDQEAVDDQLGQHVDGAPRRAAADGGRDEPFRDKETLERLYHDKGMSTVEMADVLGVTKSTILRWMDRHGIDRRDRVEAIKDSLRREYATFLTKPSGYETWAARDDGDMEWVYVHRLLAVAEYGFEDARDMVVHHRNGVKWDNRPENVELMTNAEHAEHHEETRTDGGADPGGSPLVADGGTEEIVDAGDDAEIVPTGDDYADVLDDTTDDSTEREDRESVVDLAGITGNAPPEPDTGDDVDHQELLEQAASRVKAAIGAPKGSSARAANLRVAQRYAQRAAGRYRGRVTSAEQKLTRALKADPSDVTNHAQQALHELESAPTSKSRSRDGGQRVVGILEALLYEWDDLADDEQQAIVETVLERLSHGRRTAGEVA